MALTIGKHISLEDLQHFIFKEQKAQLSTEAIPAIEKSRKYLDEKLKDGRAYYGINTGFGSLCDTVISNDQLEQLQINLLRSHACGAGEKVPTDIVRLMLALKAQSLSKGYSGVQVVTIERLLDFLNHNLLPVVYTQGSLGASGDLAPLSHLCLPLVGEGELSQGGQPVPGKFANLKLGKEDIRLQSKEGLGLINGTQFMSSYASWCLVHAKKILHLADLIAAMSLDAFFCRTEPFDEKIANVRPHAGHAATAKNIREFLSGSAIAALPKSQVQDPYSFRCIPQVHGASKDAIAHAEQVILTEINAVTDNPNVFADEDEIISGGNFHGQPLALILDYMAIALAEIGNISERRTYLLISGQRDLPPFLSKDAGLNSGFMIPQYTAASIVSKNKQLCTPASVDSIVSSNGQEDHVSMGSNAATKCYEVLNNVYSILAIELLNAAQALELRRPHTSSKTVEDFFNAFRHEVKFSSKDEFLHPKILAATQFLKNH